MSDYPAHFPSGCPPPGAQPANGHGFRFVKHDPPTNLDFRSHVEAGRAFHPIDLCKACGLSIITDPEDIMVMRASLPALRRLKLASGAFMTGVMARTAGQAESHHTWWLPAGAIVHLDFRIVPDPAGTLI